MNDEYNGQLCDPTYRLPAYLSGILTVTTTAETVPVWGERGAFVLTAPALGGVTLRFGGEAGPALAKLNWDPDDLGWRGAVGVGGVVDSIAVDEFGGVVLSLVTVVGRPILPDSTPFIPAAWRKLDGDFIPPAFEDALEDTDEGYYTFLVPDESPLAAVAENALAQRLRVWFVGRAAPDGQGWDKQVAFPLILEKTTVFAPL